MPGMDGLAFCAEVSRRRTTALTPFLFVTARGQAGDKYEGLRAGADDYVTKPFDLPDLLARVNGRLQHRARAATLERPRGRTGALATERRAAGAAAARKDQGASAAADPRRRLRRLPGAGEDRGGLRTKVALLEQRFPVIARCGSTALVGEAPIFFGSSRRS